MKTRSRPATTLFAVLVLCAAGGAQATNDIVCSGTVTTIGVHGTNRVMLRLSGMNEIVQICDLGQTIGTLYAITPEQCRAAYATLLTAFTTGTVLNVWFDNVQTGTSCTNFQAWEIATLRWVYLGT